MNAAKRSKQRVLRFVILGVLILTQSPVYAQEEFTKYAHPEMKKMDFILGEWRFDTQFIMQDGTFGKSVSRSRVKLTLNGRAIEDQYCRVLANGEVDNVGITIRSYNARKQKWLMLFYDLDLGSRTEFEGEYKDGEFHFEGGGNHNGVDVLEKVRFYDIKQDSYSWNMDRSYDGGKTWIKSFFSYKATRLK